MSGSKHRGIKPLLLAVGLGVLLRPAPAAACAACFGNSDSRLAEGMNMGILALLGVVVLVLAWVSGFFIYMARRAGANPDDGAVPEIDRSDLD